MQKRDIEEPTQPDGHCTTTQAALMHSTAWQKYSKYAKKLT